MPAVRRPRFVNICGHRVNILAMADQGDNDTVGYCKSRDNKIYIDAGLPDDQWMEILLHESLHYISDTHGLELTEKQVYSISNGVFSMGLRNWRL